MPLRLLKASHKFKAVKTQVNGIKFPSKLEARYYQHLQQLQLLGFVIGFMMQVPLHFKCGTIYKLDFLVFYDDGSARAIDVKGFETPAFKIKKKMLEQEYPWLDFEVVKHF